jgi:hypothetical protein
MIGDSSPHPLIRGGDQGMRTAPLGQTSRKFVRCIGKLLKIKSKLILIPFTFFVQYVFFFFLVDQNVVGKINKETLRIGFRINPTF